MGQFGDVFYVVFEYVCVLVGQVGCDGVGVYVGVVVYVVIDLGGEVQQLWYWCGDVVDLLQCFGQCFVQCWYDVVDWVGEVEVDVVVFVLYGGLYW